MVRRTQTTTTCITNDKGNGKENLEVFFLVRDISTNAHHVIKRSKVVTSKKVQKLEPGDEISFGQRSARVRAVILMIGTESQCNQSSLVIEKANSKSQMNKGKKKNSDKFENENDYMKDNGEFSDENNEDSAEAGAEQIDSDNENDALHIDETTPLKNIPISSSSNRSQSTVSKSTEITVGSQKRKIMADSEAEPSLKCGRTSYNKSVSTSAQGILQRRIDSLDAQILEYQTTWMPRPTDEATIHYLIDVGRILSGEQNLDPDEKIDILNRVALALNVSESQLEACKGKTIGITVRQVMKMKYPDPLIGFKFADVDRDYIAAAREYARLVHPYEEKLFTDGDLNHSMGNYFASKTHRHNP